MRVNWRESDDEALWSIKEKNVAVVRYITHFLREQCEDVAVRVIIELCQNRGS